MFTEFNWIEAVATSPVMMVLIACSVVTLGIALERAFYYARRRGNPDATLARALKSVHAGNSQEAVSTLAASRHPMGAVAAEVLKRNPNNTESIEERLHIVLSEQKLLLERNLNVLGTMAAIAPLIGLLGTVWGIMRAFHDMAKTGSAAPAVVAAGVSEALITTAAGLVIAVPALMLYNHFARRMNVMLTVAENHSRTLRTSLLESQSRSTGDAATRPTGRQRTEPVYAPGEVPTPQGSGAR